MVIATVNTCSVMAGLVPAIPTRRVCALLSGMPGQKGVYARLRGLGPGMTKERA